MQIRSGVEHVSLDSLSGMLSDILHKTPVVLITGPSVNGIGAETAISLAHGAPAILILLGRSLQKIEPVISTIQSINSSIRVKFVETDLASLASVRKAAQSILDDPEIEHIDVIINNAAIMFCPYEKTVDGFELQFASGHLGHFVLTNYLMPKILAAGPDSRIVNVSSSGNKLGSINWEDPNFTVEGSYTPLKGYGQAKTANILFSVALNKRLAGKGVHSYALHPGSVATGLQRHLDKDIADAASAIVLGDSSARTQRKTLQQGCSTTLRAALDPDLPRQEGVFLADCELVTESFWLAPWSTDPQSAERLWKLSEDLVGENFEY